jgi:DNA-binding SARP family transcriptional activator
MVLEPRFAVNLLGGFELRYADQMVRTTPAAQRLVAFVATRTTKISRTAVAQALWPDTPAARAAANLRSTLWRLRHGRGEGPISATSYGLALGPETTVDIHAVRAMTADLTHGPGGGPDRLDPAKLSDDVLPEWSEEWLLSTREWFRQIRLHALEALCRRIAARAGSVRRSGSAWRPSRASRCGRALTGRSYGRIWPRGTPLSPAAVPCIPPVAER